MSTFTLPKRHRGGISVVLGVQAVALATAACRADDITGSGWKGNASTLWSNTGNWDAIAPGNGERNLFFGAAFNTAGGSGSTTAQNDLTGYHGYRISFEDAGYGHNHTFALTGNAIDIYDYGGGSPSITNNSYLTQNVNLGVTFHSGANGNSAYISDNQGDLIFGSSTAIAVASGTNLTINGASSGAVARFNGTLTSTSAITVASTGAIGGTGTISGPITVNGTITAGAAYNTVGTLITGAQTWSTGGTYLAKATAAEGSHNDQLVMSGLTVPTSGTFNVTVNSTGGTLTLNYGTVLVLAVDTDTSTTAGTYNNPFSPANSDATLAKLTLSAPGLTVPNGYAKLSTQADTTGSGGFDLIVVAAPEPTSLVLLGVAATPLLGRRRRTTGPR